MRTAKLEPSLFENHYEIITHPPRISRLLREIHEDRAMVTLIPDEGEQAFSTAILEDSEGSGSGLFMLDEFVPREGNDSIMPNTRIWLLGQLKGVKFAFESEILESGSENGIPFHRARLPKAIRYEQRRTSYRVNVALGIKASVRLGSPEAVNPLAGQLRDLSVGGVSAILPALIRQGIQPGTVVPQCEVELPGEGTIVADTEIRHVRASADNSNTQVGLAFRNLTADAQRQVQRSVSYLEREQLRKQFDND
ncbi:flagellar brake protein [Acidihalobacter prosperus]|uniref:PilZ domain-containing protein n=1 Tax=Acidihalobacter prosperus TaxID=160660 RepID=A0A1A6C5F9_9GAMM|nr:flagellar brake protein [Acidihalobacter prosperus]OBS09784.1 hypothetical protein Thpro_020834 [Acidihalobacter prosperus]